MAFLLLLHQKMSLQRKVNKLRLEQVTIGNASERITKRIQRVQESYAKKQSRIDAEAKLGTSRTNNIVSQMLMGQTKALGCISPEQVLAQNNDPAYTELMNHQKAITSATTDAEKKAAQEALNKYMSSDTYQNAYKLANAEATKYNNNASWQKQLLNNQMNVFQTSAQEEISIWAEAQKQALADEEQLALAPLEEKQTLIDMQKASNEALLSFNEQRLQAIEQSLGQSIQGAAPKFGA